VGQTTPWLVDEDLDRFFLLLLFDLKISSDI